MLFLYRSAKCFLLTVYLKAMSQQLTITRTLGTINGKEYVEKRTEYKYDYQDDNYRWQHNVTGYTFDNGVCAWTTRDRNTCRAYNASCALIQIIADLEKNLTEHILTLDRKLRAVDEKLDEHIQDDIFTAMLKKHKQEAAQLQEKLESAESNNKELAAQLAQVTEERDKLQEWKARMQKQFE